MKYGTFLAYQSKESFLFAFRSLNESSYSFETFTPYAIEETFERPLIQKKNPVKTAGLIGAAVGLLTGFFMQYIADVLYSPMDVGGRPLNSWPAFVPVTWVMMVLCSGISIFISLWWTVKLPRPYQSIFNARHYHFDVDHFGILIHASDSPPDREYLLRLKPDQIEEVPV